MGLPVYAAPLLLLPLAGMRPTEPAAIQGAIQIDGDLDAWILENQHRLPAPAISPALDRWMRANIPTYTGPPPLPRPAPRVGPYVDPNMPRLRPGEPGFSSAWIRYHMSLGRRPPGGGNMWAINPDGSIARSQRESGEAWQDFRLRKAQAEHDRAWRELRQSARSLDNFLRRWRDGYRVY